VTPAILAAADLDRTLIFSRRALGDAASRPLRCVERHDGAPASWMTETAAGDVAALSAAGCLVPVTTRTRDQYARVTLPGRPSRWAVCANGGVLIVDGEADSRWSAAVRARLAHVAPLREIWRHAAAICRPEWTTALRNAEGLFCYAVLLPAAVPPGMIAETAAWAAGRGWRVSFQGRKLYWVPAPLTKSAAVREVAARTGAGRLVAAGDSLLDQDLLEDADAGIAARSGELVAGGWRAPHVRITDGDGGAAGEEIARWLREQAAAG